MAPKTSVPLLSTVRNTRSGRNKNGHPPLGNPSKKQVGTARKNQQAKRPKISQEDTQRAPGVCDWTSGLKSQGSTATTTTETEGSPSPPSTMLPPRPPFPPSQTRNNPNGPFSAEVRCGRGGNWPRSPEHLYEAIQTPNNITVTTRGLAGGVGRGRPPTPHPQNPQQPLPGSYPDTWMPSSIAPTVGGPFEAFASPSPPSRQQHQNLIPCYNLNHVPYVPIPGLSPSEARQRGIPHFCPPDVASPYPTQGEHTITNTNTTTTTTTTAAPRHNSFESTEHEIIVNTTETPPPPPPPQPTRRNPTRGVKREVDAEVKTEVKTEVEVKSEKVEAKAEPEPEPKVKNPPHSHGHKRKRKQEPSTIELYTDSRGLTLEPDYSFSSTDDDDSSSLDLEDIPPHDGEGGRRRRRRRTTPERRVDMLLAMLNERTP